MVLPNGKEEIGENSGSIARHALTEFSEEFYNRCKMRFSVPTIKQDMQKVQWRAIAKILCLGFHQVGYFPVYIALTSFLTCAWGLNDGKSLAKRQPFENLFQCIPEMDRHI